MQVFVCVWVCLFPFQAQMTGPITIKFGMEVVHTFDIDQKQAKKSNSIFDFVKGG